MIQREPDLEVVGEADDATQALEVVRNSPPELVLMDLHLGFPDGIETSRRILDEFPDVRILVLSGVTDPEMINRAIQTGARGYLLKTRVAEDLMRAIRAVMAGHSYLCPEVSHAVITGYQQLLASNSTPAEPGLTAREREVLKLTAEGLRIKDIANKLNIAVKTVEIHRFHLMEKLECNSSVALTRYAIRVGISPV